MSQHLQEVFDFAAPLCAQKDPAGFDTLDEVERVTFCVWIAEGEVGNGGMHAVCYNSTGDYLRYFPEGFRAIGASKKAEYFQRLFLLFGENGPSRERAIREEEHAALAEESLDAIDALTDDYFSSGEDAIELLFAYLKRCGRLVG